MAFLTLGGTVIRATRFRQVESEVSGAGVVARVWEVDAVVFSPSEASAIYARASYGLRRTAGWQLRGVAGAGNVAMAGDAGTATVRVEVSGESDYMEYRGGYARVISLRLREQVP